MSDREFLDGYGGQSLDELIAMEASHRTDSLVLAMESALDQKLAQQGPTGLSAEERVILVIEALEREVNNGGYDQFFVNDSGAYAGEIEAALRIIGCPGQADIAKRALEALGVKGALTSASLEAALDAGGDDLLDRLGDLDDEYYKCDEPIADRLFAFVKANKAKLQLR